MANLKRNHECPTCKVDFWDKTVDFINGQLGPVWKCPNCGHVDARRVNKRHNHITPAQRKAIEYAIEYNMRGRDPQKYEVVGREETVSDDGTVALKYTIQNSNPNTFGFIFPDTYLIFIGRRGGYRAFKYKTDTKESIAYTGVYALIYGRI